MTQNARRARRSLRGTGEGHLELGSGGEGGGYLVSSPPLSERVVFHLRILGLTLAANTPILPVEAPLKQYEYFRKQMFVSTRLDSTVHKKRL